MGQVYCIFRGILYGCCGPYIIHIQLKKGGAVSYKLTQQRKYLRDLERSQLRHSQQGMIDVFRRLILAFEERQEQLPVSISKRTQAVLRDAKGEGDLPKHAHRRKRWACGPKRPVKGGCSLVKTAPEL